MLLLGIDIETGNSFDADPLKEGFITEVGAVMWDTELGTPVDILSTLIYCEEVHEDATNYTGITTSMVARYGRKIEAVLTELYNMFKHADYAVAHNGTAFDRPILLRIAKENGCTLNDIPWIDTLLDVPYPPSCASKNLIYLAGFHGFCNPFHHRAVCDVLAMLKILEHYDLDEVIANAKSPMVELVWKVRYPNKGDYYGDPFAYQAAYSKFMRDKAKVQKAGFKWDSEAKEWTNKLKECFIPKPILEGVNYTVREANENEQETKKS